MMDEYKKAFERAISEVVAGQTTIERAIALACAMKLKRPKAAFNHAVGALAKCIRVGDGDTFQADVPADVASSFGVPIETIEGAIDGLELASRPMSIA